MDADNGFQARGRIIAKDQLFILLRCQALENFHGESPNM
jgi:hypothetical protein